MFQFGQQLQQPTHLRTSDVSMLDLLNFFQRLHGQAPSIKITTVSIEGDAADKSLVENIWRKEFQFRTIRRSLPGLAGGLNAAGEAVLRNNDLLSLIFSHLDITLLAPFRLVCKRWRDRLAETPVGFFAAHALSQPSMVKVYQSFPKMSALSIHEPCFERSMLPVSSLTALTALQTLRFPYIDYPQLQRLSSLNLLQSIGIVATFPYPYLTSLECVMSLSSPTEVFNAAVLSSLPNLVSLTANCRDVSRPGLALDTSRWLGLHVLTSLTRLQRLDLGWLCSVLTQEPEVLLKRMTFLQSLRAEPFHGIHLPLLRHLHSASAPVTSLGPISVPQRALLESDLPSLESLQLQEFGAVDIAQLTRLSRLATGSVVLPALPTQLRVLQIVHNPPPGPFPLMPLLHTLRLSAPSIDADLLYSAPNLTCLQLLVAGFQLVPLHLLSSLTKLQMLSLKTESSGFYGAPEVVEKYDWLACLTALRSLEVSLVSCDVLHSVATWSSSLVHLRELSVPNQALEPEMVAPMQYLTALETLTVRIFRRRMELLPLARKYLPHVNISCLER